MTVALLLASWVFWLGAGLMIGLWANRPWARGLPHHPVLHTREWVEVPGPPGTVREWEQYPTQRHLRVVEGGYEIYDWEAEGSA